MRPERRFSSRSWRGVGCLAREKGERVVLIKALELHSKCTHAAELRITDRTHLWLRALCSRQIFLQQGCCLNHRKRMSGSHSSSGVRSDESICDAAAEMVFTAERYHTANRQTWVGVAAPLHSI